MRTALSVRRMSLGKNSVNLRAVGLRLFISRYRLLTCVFVLLAMSNWPMPTVSGMGSIVSPLLKDCLDVFMGEFEDARDGGRYPNLPKRALFVDGNKALA